MTALRQKMLAELRIRGYSEHTTVNYVRRVGQFARHFGRSPDTLEMEHVRAYLTHLTERRVKVGVLINTVSGLRFFYRHVMQKDWDFGRIPYPRQPKRMPTQSEPGREPHVSLLRATRAQLSSRPRQCSRSW